MYRNASKTQTSFKAGYSPRSSLRLLMANEKELLNKISLGLDKFILNSLKARFREQGLSQIEFIEVLLKGIEGLDSEMPQRQLRLVNAIHTIYEDITMGANEKITWEMFSNYLINNVRHVKNKQEVPYTFSRSSVHPKMKFDSPIAKCVYIQPLEALMMYSQNSNKVYAVDSVKGILLPQCLQNQPRKLTVQTSMVKKERGKTVITTKELVIPTQIKVMDILYIPEPKFNVLLCSTSDGHIKGWRLTTNSFQPAVQPDSQNLHIQHGFKCPIYSMAWDAVNQVLYCGSEKGIIYAWPFKTDTELPFEGGHDSMVMCMCYITKLQILASGGMDGKLILWDIVTESKKVFKFHNRGILCMALSEAFLLFTGGFDHQICVWNPYISGLVHKVTTHASTILSFALNSNYLFSLDAENQVKIINLKTFEPIFTIWTNTEKQKSKHKCSCIALVNNPNRVVTCSNKVQFFDYDQDKNADLSDNIPIFYTYYLENSFKLYACTIERIKIWDMLTGELEETFSGFSNYELSCLLFQPSKHYILVGDTAGYISMLNIKSCLKIKELPRQPAAVDFMVPIPAVKEHDLLAIVSGYSNVNIYKVIPEGYQLTKTLQVGKNTQITTVTFHELIRQLIVGTNVGCIELYDVQNGKMSNSTASLDVYSNIVTIEVLQVNNHILLLQISYMGLASIVLKQPEKLSRIYVGKVSDIENKSQPFRVNAACWNDRESVFYLADQKGCIVACNFLPLLYEIEYSSNIHKLRKEIQILWKVKGHTESIIHMDYIQKQGLLVTSGYDKRINIWDPDTGELTDNCRQQMYHNQTAVPAFYWRVDDRGKYDIRTSSIAEAATLKSADIEPTEEDFVFNPSWLLDNIDLNEANPIISNRYWKVRINFSERIKQKKEKCQSLVQQLVLKRKNTKFQLIIKEPAIQQSISARQTSRLSVQKHIRQASHLSQQLGPYNQRYNERRLQQLPRLQRPPKLDLLSRAEQSAHKKFRQDIAVIDNELKHHHSKDTSRTHNSLANRKSTILSNYHSRQKLSKEYKSKQYKSRDQLIEKAKLVNLSNEQKNALTRLSSALRSIDGAEGVMRYEERIRLKKKVRN